MDSKNITYPDDGGDGTVHKSTKMATLDELLEKVGSCGRFQVIFVFLGYAPLLAGVWGLMFMAFGLHNPGWTCLDDNHSSASRMLNSSLSATSVGERASLRMTNFDDTSNNFDDIWTNNSSSNSAGVEYIYGKGYKNSSDSKAGNDSMENVVSSNCSVLKTCKTWKFKGSDSTIVTEWALVCDNKWVPSVIISVQMIGLMVNSYLSGHIGDRYGRKVSIFGNVALLAIANVVAVFSVSWHMFVVVRFFIGMASGGILSSTFIYNSEFISQFWRGFVATFPFWNISAGTFALTVMALKDWRHIHIATAVVSAVIFLSVFWLPESMRYLTVHRHVDKANKVVEKIARLNKRPVPDTTILDVVAENEIGNKEKVAKYNYLDLFRKNLRKASIALGLAWLFMSVIYYAIGFGISSLSGNFYLNLFLFSILAAPSRLLATVIATNVGRKFGAVLFLSLATLSCFSVVAVQLLASGEVRGAATTVFAFAANMLVEAAWGCLVVLHTEIFPTAVRNLSYGFVNGAARLGGIIAPHLMPKGSLPLFGSFAIMGVMLVVTVAGLMTLPETKGRPLQDNLIIKKTTKDVSALV